jgi:hypothetical protein
LVQKILLQEHRGQAPALKVLAIDPKSGLAGAAGFALVLFIGNLVNSFAEEDLFRGVLIPLFLREAAPWAALLPVRMTIFILVMLLGLIVIQRVGQAYDLPIVAPWGDGSQPIDAHQ